jgi:hypothetical protein
VSSVLLVYDFPYYTWLLRIRSFVQGWWGGLTIGPLFCARPVGRSVLLCNVEKYQHLVCSFVQGQLGNPAFGLLFCAWPVGRSVILCNVGK